MRPYLLLLSASVMLLSNSCTPQQPEAQQEAQPEYRLHATIKDLMDSMVDPSADVLWDSFETIVDEKGIHENVPRTDDEWATVRHAALALVETTNLLLIPGRHVALPGEKAEDPKVELEPEQIEALINKDRQSWTMKVHDLNDVAMEALAAIEAKDVGKILVAGDKLDKVCGNCHDTYWYPAEAERRKQLELKKRQQQQSQQ